MMSDWHNISKDFFFFTVKQIYLHSINCTQAFSFHKVTDRQHFPKEACSKSACKIQTMSWVQVNILMYVVWCKWYYYVHVIRHFPAVFGQMQPCNSTTIPKPRCFQLGGFWPAGSTSEWNGCCVRPDTLWGDANERRLVLMQQWSTVVWNKTFQCCEMPDMYRQEVSKWCVKCGVPVGQRVGLIKI